MTLLSLFTYSVLLLSTAVLGTVIQTRQDEPEIIAITIFDCDPTIDFNSYRLVCDDVLENDNSCEGRKAFTTEDLGLGSIEIPPKEKIPTGCELGAEGLGVVGVLHMKVGTTMTVGIVWYTDGHSEGSVVSGAGSMASVSNVSFAPTKSHMVTCKDARLYSVIDNQTT